MEMLLHYGITNHIRKLLHLDDINVQACSRDSLYGTVTKSAENCEVFVAQFVIICPSYSMGQIIKSVCVCQRICPSASTLTVAFLDRFSPKFTTDVSTPKGRTSSLGVSISRYPFPYLSQKTHFRPRGPENSCKY